MLKTYIKQLKQNATSIGEGADIIWSSIRYGASPNNYHDFGFNNLTAKERKTYVTNRFSRRIIRKYNNSEYIDIFEDKIRFAQRFEKYFGRDWISTENMNYEMFRNFISGKDKIIYKPISNAQGQGIIVYDDLSDGENLFNEIKEKNEKAILEEWICQHEEFAKIYSKAINCLRIITFYNGEKVNFLTGGVTWGNGKKIANASASGIVSPVNFGNGRLEKPAADFLGKIYKQHPITGQNLQGVSIPYWKETLEMLTGAAKEVPQVAYIGWDVAITPQGPIIIEGNTTPGYRYYQIPVHMKEKLGNRKIYERSLKKF